MSEFKFVEQPLLKQLENLGWEIILHPSGIPSDPKTSLRNSFKEVCLKKVFQQSIQKINRHNGQEWLTENQLNELYEEITNTPWKNLHEANKEILKLLRKNTKVDRNTVTNEEYPVVKLIDFDNVQNNSFIAINQFRITTPGGGKNFIIPDIVLFVNGMPMVVIECKDQTVFTANPINQAIEQLQRYSNQRENTKRDGLTEGCEKLFWFNLLNMATYGEDARYGTFTSTDQHYFQWKHIEPEFETFQPPLGEIRPQETLVQGMLPPANLLNILRHYTLFMEIDNGMEIKIIGRYQQYRAVEKIIKRIQTGQTPIERSGVVWHTQGSGKSLTMIFLIRKMRTTQHLNQYKLLLLNDRTDLETQLGNTALLTDEPVEYINNISKVHSELANNKSNINMVMIQKFQERNNNQLPDYIQKEIVQAAEPVEKYNSIGIVNKSDKILVLIDEAHRTQGSDMGNNLFEAFPNSTKIAFTGTPLITERHKKKTVDRFGDYIDKYKLQDAVDDGATIQILYEGKTADIAITDKAGFDNKFEDLFQERTEAELLEIKKKYGTYGDILEAELRIEAIAEDLVAHYITNILENNFKAQVVCSSKLAAIRYQKYIRQALAKQIQEIKQNPESNPEHIQKLEFLKTAVVLSADETNEDAAITQARKEARKNKAIENFKKPFNHEEPNTGIAFIIVCDMLLTGFDAPIEQVMYIDKKLKEHNLLQAIARVNRVVSNKPRGYIVDYIGLANNLKEALSIYSGEDYNDIVNSMKDINSEIPLLESRYNRLLQLFKENGITQIESFVKQTITDSKTEYDLLEQTIQLLADIHLRANFETFLKKFNQSMDVILPNRAAFPYRGPIFRFNYIFHKVKHRYKDTSINVSNAGNKVKNLVNQHLISLGIDPKIPPTELFSDKFIQEVEKNQSSKAKASEMEHAIRKHIKVKWEEDPALYRRLSEKLDNIINQHKTDNQKMYEAMCELRSEMHKGRQNEIKGIDKHEAPFYDLVLDIVYKGQIINDSDLENIKPIIKELIQEFQSNITISNFWNKPTEIEELSGKMIEIIYIGASKNGLNQLIEKAENVVTEIMALAKKRHFDLVGK